VIGFTIGFLGDYSLRRKWIEKRVLRGVAQSIAMLGAASLLIALAASISSVHTNPTKLHAVALVSAAMAINAFSAAGHSVNHFDLAPRHSGFLYGMNNSMSLVPGVVGVPLTGWMLEVSGWQWEGVFGLAAAHYLVGLGVFLVFSSYSPIVK
jgi:predicted MFS family arabinose efflux permease